VKIVFKKKFSTQISEAADKFNEKIAVIFKNIISKIS